MSNKAHSKLTPSDRIIRETIAATKDSGWGENGTLVTIEFVSGFEMFNTRPYHNYETWGNGYRIRGRGVAVKREDLDEALFVWNRAVWESFITYDGRTPAKGLDVEGSSTECNESSKTTEKPA